MDSINQLSSVSPHDPSPGADTDKDSIARLQDAVPQLESLFNISHCIGHGTFSSVYLARIKHTTTINGRRHFAIKHIIPTSHPSRVYMELKCLKMIGGLDNVMGVTMCFRQMNHIVLVMPHFPHDSFSDYVGHLSTQELRDYLTNLLMALRRVHSFNIIHRDVKPANFLYNRKHRRYSLVDFGLAQEVGQGKGVVSEQGRAAAGSGASRAFLPALDTPLTASTRTVKRKLSVYSGDEEHEGEGSKRPCYSTTSPSPGVTGILSSTTSRLNTTLRRSPRKKCLSHLSPKKENFETLGKQEHPNTPLKATYNPVPLEDSPSKPTHSAEACQRSEPLDGGGGGGCVQGQKSMGSSLQARLESAQGLRRSPRKLAAACHKVAPLEGLAKHLHEVSTFQSMATAGVVSSCESSLSVHQRPRHPAADSPRVSGLTFTPDLNGTTVPRPLKNCRVLQEVQTISGSMLRPVSCHCYGTAKVCGVCLARSNQVAPRAGTPGFRAPEVLLRHPNQDTGVDMWSVGVVMLCLLSGRYPFFRAADDLSNLAEITSLLGTTPVRRAAAKMGKLLKCSEEKFPVDLMKVCEILRNNTLRPGAPEAQGEPCVSCRQRAICVCLAPPTSGSPRRPQKKRPHQHKKEATPTRTPGHTHRPSISTVNVTHPSDHLFTVPSPSQGVVGEGEGAGPPHVYPALAYHLLLRLLDPSPETRITAEEALAHPFLSFQAT